MAVERVVTTAFGRAATEALAEVVRAMQGGDPFRPVTVVVPSNLAGLTARHAFGAAGGIANVGFVTPAELVERLARPDLAASGLAPMTDATLLAAIRAELAADPGEFGPVAGHPATERALADRLRELARARPATRARIEARGSERGRRLVALADRVGRRLRHHADEATATAAALAAVPGARAGLGAVVVHLPEPSPAGVRDVLAAVLRSGPAAAVVGRTGDAEADAPVLAEAARLGIPVGSDAQGATVTGTEILTASDVDEEVRAAVRRICALAADGVALDRIAVLFPPIEPYARTVSAQLAAAGIAHNGPAVRTLADTVAGRTLARIVALVESRIARDELIDLLTCAPVPAPDGRRIPVERWDRVSRRAGVVDGDDWDGRLHRHAADLDAQAADRDAADLGGGDALRRDAAAARDLAEHVAGLRDRLARIERASGWRARAGATAAVLDEMVALRLPETEQVAVEAARDALASLGALDAIEPAPSLATFVAAVTGELQTPVGRLGRFGEGVLVGTIGASVGLDVDAVLVLGLAEGRYPVPRREDALLAEADRALAEDGDLVSRDDTADQLRRFRTALAAGARHRVLSYARGDLRTARELVPSRLLLETASALHGERVFASDFPRLGPADGVDAVPSFAAGLDRADDAPSLVERDLARVARSVAGGGDAATSPLVVGTPVAVGIEAVRARASGALTRWDGNVGTVAAAVPSPTAGEVVSATRLETWAECPMRYFLAQVLRVPVEDTPERLLELSPLDRGTLVHAVLEQFVREELERPEAERTPPGRPWPPTAMERMRAIMDEQAADAEARGLTGKAVLWELHRDAIEVDLATFLLADGAERVRTGAVPESVELPFGLDGAPPVDVALADGRRVRFRGRADRVDRLPDGGCVVIDYKTGRVPPVPAGCDDDPVWGGERLQLPLYAEAARVLLGADRVSAVYWYVSQRGNFARVPVELDELTARRFREVVGGIVDAVDAGVFPATPGEPNWYLGTEENCGYCDYRDLCPVERAAQFDAKVDAPELRHWHDLAPEPDPDAEVAP